MKYHFPIETERLSLRLLTPEDLSAWSVFFINNPQLHYVGVIEEAEPLVHAKKWMDRQLTRYTETGLGMLAMIEKATGQLIGQVGILQRDVDGENMHEIGYGIIPEKWGEGFASEGAIRMKQYLIEHHIDSKVISLIHPDNIGSQRVAENNGMNREREWLFEGKPCHIYRQDL